MDVHDHHGAGLFLMFAPGARPNAAIVEEALSRSAPWQPAVHVRRGSASGESWLEFNISGMTFDMLVLPAEARPMGVVETHYGVGSLEVGETFEGVAIVPGPHLTAASGKLPVVRALCDIASRLCDAFEVRAIGYAPARTSMSRDYFAAIVKRWLGGGPFPVRGLTSLTLTSDGGVRSKGLDHFLGRELQLQPTKGEEAEEALQAAERLIDRLIRDGAPEDPSEIDIAGDRVYLEPSRYGNLLLAWRGVTA